MAGQLPFVFSEIIRYPGQTAAKWISLVGKNRSGEESVRIMNFDIGGGTTDISVVEYQDKNDKKAAVMDNLLSTRLLFKDGQAVAGDDLVKKIIERIILGGLMRDKKGIPGLVSNIARQFTQSFTNKEDEALRCRIVRTCLIPLATKCLSSLGKEGKVEFSPQMAGVNNNNWEDFLDFIGIQKKAIPFNNVCFSFNCKDVNELIEQQFNVIFRQCAIYAAAYDVDMLIFSGKPSELPYIRTMARKYIPMDDGRIIFAREFKAGHWYPFTDDKGYIKDAKTVTVVGGALYYALANGFISGWTIEAGKNIVKRNEWGQLTAMKSSRGVFLGKDEDGAEVSILPNTIIARRQNVCSSPEPVYKFVSKVEGTANQPVKVAFKRNLTEDGEVLSIQMINGSTENAGDFELKLWPSENGNGVDFWQERGIFECLEGAEA